MIGFWAAVVQLGVVGAAFAEVASLTPIADNTLYEDVTGALSNGAGTGMFAGKNASGLIRRAVVAFDVAGAVPAGATINSVTLTMNMSQTPAGNQNVALHRLLADWGEGTSVAGGAGGGGAPSTSGDATWIHTFFNTSFWSAVGGDYAASPSASTTVGSAIGNYVWTSTPAMVADVQAWLDSPSSDFGWAVVGNEAVVQTLKRFDTREISTPALRPTLTINYTPAAAVPTLSQKGLFAMGLLLLTIGSIVMAARGSPGGLSDPR